jgi:lipid-A-disaccharide synthase-like uncharacterized protein
MVLLLTICSQIVTQWRAGASRDVSPLLFVGQFVASGGFLIYSWQIGSPVFVVTNASMAASALVGLGILAKHRRRRGGPAAAGPGPLRMPPA